MTRQTHDAAILRMQAKIKKTKAKTKASKDTQSGKYTEIGGPKGVEPTRYSDWERKGVARDF
ncbi:MAG: DUF1674 domain-containing protein [Alphaproteobacteria bacterium]